ncbi:unnamed protein product [Gadus morhua 'NCC']
MVVFIYLCVSMCVCVCVCVCTRNVCIESSASHISLKVEQLIGYSASQSFFFIFLLLFSPVVSVPPSGHSRFISGSPSESSSVLHSINMTLSYVCQKIHKRGLLFEFKC